MATEDEVRSFYKRNLPTLTKIVGGLVGVAAGYATGEIFAGALVAPIVASSLDKAGNEIIERVLAPRQVARVESVIGIAAIKILAAQGAGAQVRDDDFFEPNAKGRSQADEITESVIIAAMKTTQERKLPFIAALIAEFAFNQLIDHDLAHYLVNLAEEMSFRVFCAIHIINRGYPVGYEPGAPLSRTVLMSSAHSIMADLLKLTQQGLLEAFNEDGEEVFLTSIQGIDPRRLRLTEIGRTLHRCLDLKALDENDRTYKETKILLEDVMRSRNGKMAAIDAGKF